MSNSSGNNFSFGEYFVTLLIGIWTGMSLLAHKLMASIFNSGPKFLEFSIGSVILALVVARLLRGRTSS